MSERPVDLSFLQKAIARLDAGLTRYRQDIHDEQIRDGLIQRFEFTYEISHKMLRRFLELTSANPAEFDGMAFQDMIRTGNERGLLLGDWPAWRKYREMRSKANHTHDEYVAMEVVKDIPAFRQEASHLKKQLHNRIP